MDPDSYLSCVASLGHGIVVATPSVGAVVALVLSLLLLCISGFVSASEIAFFSLSPSDLNDVEEENHPADKRVKALLTNSDRLEATIVLSNNFVNVAIIMLLNYFFVSVVDFGEMRVLGFVSVTVILVFLLLVFGEIMPRIYSAQHALRFCRKWAAVMSVLCSLFRPLSNLLAHSSLVANKFSQRKKTNLSVDELSQALELTDKNEISEESNMLEGFIRFGEETAKEVMTSRLDMVDLDIETPFSKVLRCIVDNAYSRIPVYEDTRDNIKGILYIKDLLPYLDKDDTFRWQKLIRPAFLGAYGEGGDTWMNGPSLRNWGMEFNVGYRNNFANGLGLDVNVNADFFRNRVTYLPETTTGSYAHTSTENLVQARQPYGSIVGYVCEGIFQSQAEVDASGQANARVGGLKYADLDHNGSINDADQTWIYNPVPKFSYGLNIALSYKNFDLSMFWQGVCGKDVYNNQKFQTDFWAVNDPGSNKGERVLDAWTTGNTDSTIPALSTMNTADEGRASSYFVENGSYLKLRNLQLGYSLPQSLLSRLKMTNARVYVSGQNLLTIKSKSLTCTDPENPDWNYPLATSVSFGVQIGF